MRFKADIALVINTPSSLLPKQQELITFLSQFINNFDVGEDAVRFAALAFNGQSVSGPRFSFNFGDYSTKREVQQNVNTSVTNRFVSGGSGADVPAALRFARQVFFQRPSTGPKYLIIFLNELDPSQRQNIQAEAELLRRDRILTVGVSYEGSQITMEQLGYVAFNNSRDLSWRSLSLRFGEFDLLQTLQQGSAVFMAAPAVTAPPTGGVVPTPGSPGPGQLAIITMATTPLLFLLLKPKCYTPTPAESNTHAF